MWIEEPLPMDVVEEIRPLFARLSDKKLLEKCLHGYTQNQNEALNKEIWSLCHKTINVGERTVHTAVALAVAIMNMAGLQKKELQNDSSYDMLHGWQGW